MTSHDDQDARAALDMIPALIATMTATGEVAYVNHALVEYIGLSREELTRWALGDAVHPDDLPRVLETWRRCVATGDDYDIEHRIRRADGSYLWFHVRGKPQRDEAGRIVRWCNVLSDIDARKASERELGLIIETIPGLVWCASVDGELTYVNQRILDLIGVTFEALLEGRWSDLIHAEERDATVHAWFCAVTTGAPLDIRFRIRRHDGGHQWVRSVAQLGCDDSHTPTRWYGMLMDIDEQQRADDTLNEMRARLMHAARVATVAELSASIAHEITQPLTAVVSNGQSCSNWLAAEPPNLEKARRAAERVMRDGTQAGEIVSRLRALFRHDPLERVSLSMNQLVSDGLDLVRSEAARRRAVVQAQLEASLPPVVGDRVQLQQLVLNLVQNALDALDATVDHPRTVLVRSALDSNEVRVEVVDSGNGLPDVHKVFEAFVTTKAHGMGMGLAICRSIVDAHGGRLWASNNEGGGDGGRGACFTFTLPVAE